MVFLNSFATSRSIISVYYKLINESDSQAVFTSAHPFNLPSVILFMIRSSVRPFSQSGKYRSVRSSDSMSVVMCQSDSRSVGGSVGLPFSQSVYSFVHPFVHQPLLQLDHLHRHPLGHPPVFRQPKPPVVRPFLCASACSSNISRLPFIPVHLSSPWLW